MYIKIIKETGYNSSMLGLSLNKNQPVQNMPEVARRLSKLGNGHDNFLEMLILYVDIRLPRYWWQQFDRYRMCSRQSASTMHTIMQQHLTRGDFVNGVEDHTIKFLNMLIDGKELTLLKACLPEGFLQRRVVMMSYKTLRNIIKQRKYHRLPEWKFFISEIKNQIKHMEFLADLFL